MDKAKQTRAANKALRDARRAERAAQEQADKALVLDALRAVLKDPEATSAQRLYAVAVLENMQGYRFAPYDVKYPGRETEVDLTRFQKEIDKRL